MKLLISALTLGFALAGAASQAQAHVCADGSHRTHCVYHRHVVHHQHHHFHYVEEAPPRGVYYYPPYSYYYPPTPATIFDIPPEDRLPANQLQFKMNRLGDRPFADDTPY
ncbi:MAG TPA: hypothetical protein VL492_00130 [Methylovirgula sp.]|jgi:hypothetical protein|nr:hypothetical protein [Methylovirgula sp.]